MGAYASYSGDIRIVDRTIELLVQLIADLVRLISACPVCWLVSALLFALVGNDIAASDLSPLVQACAVLVLLPTAQVTLAAARGKCAEQPRPARPTRIWTQPPCVLPYSRLAPFLSESVFDRWRR